MLECQNISLSLDKKKILQDISFTVESSKSILILGPSGCGKTSLLSILTGLRKPDSGSVILGKTNIHSLTASKADKYRGKNIGIVFQNFHILRSFTVEQNLLLAQTMSGNKANISYLRELADRLALSDKLQQKALNLSVGEIQRLSVARSLITKPKWLFCDEPTSSLDDQNAQNMLELLRDEAKETGSSMIIVTHDKRIKDNFINEQILELKK